MGFQFANGFPADSYKMFEKLALSRFPDLLSDDCPPDIQQQSQHFEAAHLGVAFRFRGAHESATNFSELHEKLVATGEIRQNYLNCRFELDREVFIFFSAALSSLESLTFALYFLGHRLSAGEFGLIANPSKIKLSTTSDAYQSAFPSEPLAVQLQQLQRDPWYCELSGIRNIVVHRASGMPQRNETWSDEAPPAVEELWFMPGEGGSITLRPDRLGGWVNDLAGHLGSLLDAAQRLLTRLPMT